MCTVGLLVTVSSKSMVVSRSEVKRRRKEGNVLEDPLQDNPKRTKVHAQRKFAQGSSNLSSPALTPVKDKDKVKTNGTVMSPELIPSKRPKTEDFLTFLCFRGTPILPPSLDFFNVASVQENQDEEQSVGDFGRDNARSGRAASTSTNNQRPQRSLDRNSSESMNVNIGRRNEKLDVDCKKKMQTAVQVLRQKYQEQRLAKHRTTTLSQLAQKVKGKNMVRTRSTTHHEEPNKNVSHTTIPGKKYIKKNIGNFKRKEVKRSKCDNLKKTSSLQTRTPSNLRGRRGGLRSGGQLPPGSAAGLKSDRRPKQGISSKPLVKKSTPKIEVKLSILEKSKVFASSLSDFSSEDDQPLAKKLKPGEPSGKQQLARKVIKRIIRGPKKLKPRMVTRSNLPVSSHLVPSPRVSSRPSRKTKEAAALYMELLGKKLINPDDEADEDSLSIDSFPELPNAKRSEQRENEIKANASKNKKNIALPKENKNNVKSKSEAKEDIKEIKGSEENLSKKNKKEIVKKMDSKEKSVTESQIKKNVVQKVNMDEVEEREKRPMRKCSLSKPLVDHSGSEDWEDEEEDAMKPPSAPRRSLRRGSYQLSDSEAYFLTTFKPRRKKCSARKPGCKKSSARSNSSLSEERYSDSDEEPLGKILSKTGLNMKKTQDISQQKSKGTAQSHEEKDIARNKKMKEGIGKNKKHESTSDKVVPKNKKKQSLQAKEEKCQSGDPNRNKSSVKVEGSTVEVPAVSKSKQVISADKGIPSTRTAVDIDRKKKQTHLTDDVSTQKLAVGLLKDKEAKNTKTENITKILSATSNTQITGIVEKKNVRKGTAVKSEIVKSESKHMMESENSNKETLKGKDASNVEKEECKRIVEKLVYESRKELNISNKVRSMGSKNKHDNSKKSLLNMSSGSEDSASMGSKLSKVSKLNKEIMQNLPVSNPPIQSSTSKLKNQFTICCQPNKSNSSSDSHVESSEAIAKLLNKSGDSSEFTFSESSPPEKTQLIKTCDKLSVKTISETLVPLKILSSKESQVTPDPKVKPTNSQPQVKEDEISIPKSTEPPSSNVERDAGEAEAPEVLSLQETRCRDLKSKGKVNMSTEQIEKWLNESYIGSPHHKKDSLCKCSISDDVDLEGFPSFSVDKQSSLDKCNKFENPEAKLSKGIVGTPLYLREVTGHEIYKSETISAFRLDEFKQKLLESSVLKTESINSKKGVQSEEVEASTSLESKVVKTSQIAHNYVLPVKQSLGKPATPTLVKQGTIPKEAANEAQKGSNLRTIRIKKELGEEEEKQGTSLKLHNQIPVDGTSKCGYHTVKNELVSSSNVEPPNEVTKEVLIKPVNKGEVDPVRNKKHLTPEKSGEKKSIFQQRRPFLHKVKERKDLTPSANAFSPENESSVYAFETEPELPPASTPFRRRARDSRTSSTATSRSEEDLAKLGEDEVSPLRSLPTIASTNRRSTSIAVQVNLDSETSAETNLQSLGVQEQLEAESGFMECSTQTEEDEDNESEGHLFYIPLQQAPGAGGAHVTPSQQLIQGVAVKLGTEGPTGPNQRVIMRAKLVTKPPTFNRVTSNSQEAGPLGARRSVLSQSHQRSAGIIMMEQKGYGTPLGTCSTGTSTSTATYPPVGTVQPTARSQPTINATLAMPHPLRTVPPTLNPSIATQSNMTKPCALVAAARPVQKQAAALKNSLHSSGAIYKPPATKLQMSAKERRSSMDQGSAGTSSSKPGAPASKRPYQKSKAQRTSEASYVCTPTNVTSFPSVGSPAQLVDAPTFHPSEKEFQDPLEYIDKIRPIAEKFGLCRVVPPSTFKPECKVSDDMRFTAYNQYVHKMLHRWGPNVKEMMAIRKYLATQSIPFTHPPWIGGMEVDLPRLYQTVQGFGGLKEVIEKKKWQRVADGMKIPKSAQDRVTKLDDIYCKYLLPYDTLSPDERQRLFDDVEAEWAARESRAARRDVSGSSDTLEEDSDGDALDENEECIVKGRSMPLNAFYRIARNTMSMWFRQPEPSSVEVEQEFWRHVMSRQSHVCIHSGSIDSSGWGYGFPCSKNSPFARHPWNLKVLTNNSGSVLRSIGPIMGVTVPTLHVGMLFTTCCWYRDPHGLPWVEYLHTGANKIWYGIPDEYSSVFRSALTKLVPRYCRNKTIWLPSDTAMVPPPMLVKEGVSLCHTVQKPGQFILVFPRAFTSSICTGYLVSESVYFAQPSWLTSAESVFKDIQESCEPSMVSLERLLFSIAADSRSHVDVLRQVLPMVIRIRQQELDYRKQLYALGLKTSERLALPEANLKRRKARATREDEGDYECEMCRANLFVSLVTNSHEEGVYCLPHAIDLLTKKRHHLKYCKLMYTYDQVELNELVQKLEDKIEVKSQKKSVAKHASSLQKV